MTPRVIFYTSSLTLHKANHNCITVPPTYFPPVTGFKKTCNNKHDWSPKTWRLQRESDLSLILSPQQRKSELPIHCLTSCAPSPCEVFTEQQSLWPAPLTLPPSPGSSQAAWQKERSVCPHTASLRSHTHIPASLVTIFMAFIYSLFAHSTLSYFLQKKLYLPMGANWAASQDLLEGWVPCSKAAWRKGEEHHSFSTQHWQLYNVLPWRGQ